MAGKIITVDLSRNDVFPAPQRHQLSSGKTDDYAKGSGGLRPSGKGGEVYRDG